MDDVSPAPGRAIPLVIVRLCATLAGLALAAAVVGASVAIAGIVTVPEVAVVPAPRLAPLATTARFTVAPATAAPATLTPATRTPTPVPTTPPSPVTPAVSAVPYVNERGNYIALSVRPGAVFGAPFAGTVQIRLYQFIDGDIRLNANDRTRPVFPYLTLIGPDKRMIYRLGELTKDSEVQVEDGAVVKVGEPLFKVIAAGPSSWNSFYDSGMRAQVLVSLAALPSGRELDPLPFLPLG